MNLTKYLPLFLFCLLSPLCARAATIRGYVVNGKGDPVGEARVEIANPYQPLAGLRNFIKADANGYFSKDGIEPGFYMVYGSKEAEHYGDARFALFAARLNVPEVTVAKSDEVITVKVDLGRPGAILKGVLLDEQTDEPIPDVNLKLILQDDSEKYILFGSKSDGKFERLMPSQPVTISATKEGYQPFTTTLSLNPDEQKTLTIRMKSIEHP